MNFERWLRMRLFSAEGAQGGAGDGTGGDGTAGDGTSGLTPPGLVTPLDDKGGQQQISEWKLPDGLPDHLKANTQEEFLPKILDDWKKQRTSAQDFATKFKAPDTAEAYTYEPSEKVKPFIGDLAKDPVFGFAREAAHKAGVPAAMFSGFVGGLYETMVEKGLVAKPYSPAAERSTFLGEASKTMSEAQQVETMKPIIEGALSWADGLKSQSIIDDAGHREIASLADSAAGLRALVALQNHFKLPGIVPGGQQTTTTTTRADLQARQRDPRNDPDNAQYDKAYREETQRLYRTIS